MSGILNNRLKFKIDQLQSYVQRKLLDMGDCDAEMRTDMVAEISSRITTEIEILLDNAISVLSQECLDRFSADSDRLQHYFDLDLERKIKDKYHPNFDFISQMNSIPGNKNQKAKAVGIGAMGAAVAAFIARRMAVSVLSPQVALAVLISATICYFASSALLSNGGRRRYAEFVSKVVNDMATTVCEWLDNLEKDFTSIVASI